MTLIDVVARLKKLEAEATRAPWTLLGNIDFQIVSDNPEFYINFDDSDKADPELITELRNTAPALLEILGAFQEGDAATLAVIAERFAMSCPDGMGCPTCAAERDVINRLTNAACEMEAKQE
jgi:hypothetical protein